MTTRALNSHPTANLTPNRRSLRRWLSSRRGQKTLTFYLFILPWLLGFIALTVIPLSGGFALSFTNYDGLNLTTMKFLGAGNYTRIFNDEDALFSLRRVLLWSALNVPIWLCTSFVLAWLLNHSIKGRGLFRTLFYLPSVK